MFFTSLLKKKIVLLDGAMGTQLQAKGLVEGVCPEAWCRDNPKVLSDIHAAYVAAGSDIIYTCTFGANPVKLSNYGITDTRQLNRDLCRLAKNAAGTRALVAGDIGPTGKFVQPFGELDFEDAVKAFKAQIKGLVDGGADLLVIETMMDIQEARAALIAAKETSDLPVMVTMTFERSGRTLGGTDPLSALITLQSLGAGAVGCNCSSGPQDMLAIIKLLKPYAMVPLAAKPNAGLPRLLKNNAVYDMDPRGFAAFADDFAAAGVNLLGGCCGTSPAHIAALAARLKGRKPQSPKITALSAISGPFGHLLFRKKKKLFVIGERINPSGKRALRESLSNKDFSLVRESAHRQEDEGAQALDVNLSVPGGDEPWLFKQALKELAVLCRVPLVMDSSDSKAIEAALRFYPGRAMINSISGEKIKLKKLLPLAAKYGAMFMLLPLDDKGIPLEFKYRRRIIDSILKQAAKLSILPQDIVVDALALAVSAQPGGPAAALETVEWCFRQGLLTSLGLSNVSFGLPQRQWLNSAFLAQAAGRGLTMAIMNPGSIEAANIRLASDVLTGADKDAGQYLAGFSTAQEKPREAVSLSLPDKITACILEGGRDSLIPLLDAETAAGSEAQDIIDRVMIPAITEAGARFESRQYFLPQLLAAAETMEKGVKHLEPLLEKGSRDTGSTVVILATVEGDIHDIGKNIVALILRNHGFKVVDLGRDVSASRIVKEAASQPGAVVGLSALMTTTMVKMKDVISLAAARGCRCKFLLGGAVLNKGYAASLGAAFAKDGVEAVRVIREMVDGR